MSATQVAAVGTIAALRATTTGTLVQDACYVEGFSSPADGGEGLFTVKSTDVSSADNGGTLIVDASGRRWYRESSGRVLNVAWFGAKGVGGAGSDDTGPIQAAIAALPAGGGEVLFPPGTYNISSTINLGNGSSTGASTQHGGILRGVGQPIIPYPFSTGFPTTSPVHLNWIGGASPVIQVSGPMQGWGIHNIFINGNVQATIGINIVSSMFGDSSNITVIGCTSAGICSTTLPPFGSLTLLDSLSNYFRNIFIFVPDVAGSKGLLLTGAGAGASNTDYIDVTNINILLPPTQNTYGIYIQNADSCHLRNVHFEGGAGAGVGVCYDYAPSGGTFPCGCVIWGIDPSGPLTSFVRNGTPATAHRQNVVYAVTQANGSTYPNIKNLSLDLPQTTDTINLLSQEAGITSGSLTSENQQGLYRISGYLGVTSTGSAVTVACQIYCNDGVQLQSKSSDQVSLSGYNFTQFSFVMFAGSASQTGISYGTTLSGSPGSGQYQLHLTCEFLGPAAFQS